MRTLICCPSFADSKSDWAERYTRWRRAIEISGLLYDQVLLVDDGSMSLPLWNDIEIIEDGDFVLSNSKLVLYHFKDRRGRKSIHDFPGWYRSYARSARWAQDGGFERVIHLESDAHIISPRASAYINSVDDEWLAMWCPKYQFPEIAIQVIAGRGLQRWQNFVSDPLIDPLMKQDHEQNLPLTFVERQLKGDRYGEIDNFVVPKDADWATQMRGGDENFWWLRGH